MHDLAGGAVITDPGGAQGAFDQALQSATLQGFPWWLTKSMERAPIRFEGASLKWPQLERF